MAVMGTPNPWEPLNKIQPRTGPMVQNMGGLARNTAPLAQRPVQLPAVKAGPPGPAPLGPSPNPGGGRGTVPPVKTLAPQPEATVGGGNMSPAPNQPTTPVPAAPVAAPAPAPAPQTGGTDPAPAAGGASLYGQYGGATAAGGSLEDKIRQALSGQFEGAVSKGYIDRAKSQLGSAVEGQRQQAVRRSDDDLIRRGMFRSGIGAENAAAAGTAAQGSLAAGIADILNNAENQNIQGRQFATGAATNLLGMNRDFDQQEMARREAAAARAAAGAPRMFTFVDPDTGMSYEMDEAWF